MSFRGLATGVSGLKAQSKKMEVIGNNLANVNTAGYKSDRVNFHDVYYQIVQHASKGDGGNIGGTNPQEIGMGVQVGSIDKIFTQGSKNITGRTFDFMIEGDDFFVAKNSSTTELMLTRNGAFQLDGDMYLVDSMNNKIQGFNVDRESGIIDGVAQNIQIQSGSINAKATTQVDLSSNIDSSLSETSATSTTNAWEVFSGGENFAKMTISISGLSGSKADYGSGYYQDSYNYTDKSALLETSGNTIVLNSSPSNLIEGFSVGDIVSLVQDDKQAQRSIESIDVANRRITISTNVPSGFNTGSSIAISNLTDGVSSMGSSGSSYIHNDILRSQICLVDENGKLLASFFRVSGDPSEYSRAKANIQGGGEVTIGTGEFTKIHELKDLIERTLRDSQLSYYTSSSDLNVKIDEFGKLTFNGTGLVNKFRLVINAANEEMLDRFSNIAITDNGETPSTQARIDLNGEIISPPSLGMSSRTVNSSKNWFDASGIENYGYNSTNSATEYGEYAGLKLDGGSNGNGYGVLQLSTENALGNTVLQEFKLESRNADPSKHEFSTMGELASLLQTTLRSSDFSSIAEDGSLVEDLTATVTFNKGRLKISTSNGSFKNLALNPVNITSNSSQGISRSDKSNFATILGALSEGINGKEGTSNSFIQSDVRSQTRIYDSQGNEHTAVTYFIRDRSAGLNNIEWKFMNSLQPNINTFAENSPSEQSIYQKTFNSIQDTSSSRGVIAFDINTGNILDNTSSNGDSRYSSGGTLTFVPQETSLEANTSKIDIDFSNLTSFNGENTVTGNNMDGYSIGNIVRISSEQNTGNVKGTYSNGQTRILAKIGLMHIDNPEGLQKMGTSYFTQTNNSNAGSTIKGLDNVFSVNSAKGTSVDSIDSKIHGNALEASNVDVTQELTDMIITQRSYSASGKTITTLDDMIQEALSLKR